MSAVDAIRWLELSDEDIQRLHTAVANALRDVPHVVAAYHYGSSARRQPARDIDIGLIVERDAMLSVDTIRIGERIAAACQRDTDEFDVRILNDADAVFLGNLMRDGKICYEHDREQRVAFEVRAMNAWFDFQPIWHRLRQRVLKAWSHG